MNTAAHTDCYNGGYQRKLSARFSDEHDEGNREHQTLRQGHTVNASMDLDDFCEYFEIETESESTSLSGWIMEQMEEIPEGGETFKYENLTITVGKVDNHRITEEGCLCAQRGIGI